MADCFVIYGLRASRRVRLFTWLGSAARGLALAKRQAPDFGMEFDAFEACWEQVDGHRG